MNTSEFYQITEPWLQLYNESFIEDDSKFEIELKSKFNSMKLNNIWTKFIQSAYEVISDRIANIEKYKDWYKKCFNEYSKMNFKFSTGKLDENGDEIRLPIEKLSTENQKKLIKAKIIGNFLENIVNFVLYNAILDKNKAFIINDNIIKRSTADCELWVVDEKKDRGIDSILYWPKKNQTMCIQTKFRNFNSEPLDVDELVSKMRNEMFINETGKEIRYYCGYDEEKNHTFALAINRGLDAIKDKRFSYGIMNDKKHRDYNKNKSLNADLTFFMDNVFFDEMIKGNEENLFGYFHMKGE